MNAPFISASTTVYTGTFSTLLCVTVSGPDYAGGSLTAVTGLCDPSLSETGNPAATVTTAATPRDIAWSFVLCDLAGNPITILDNVATGRQITYTLNRPAQVQFVVPSDSPRANLTHTDGDPYLNEMNRVLKCYRLEQSGWVLRFAGIVFQIQDEADETSARSSVTAYDPSQVLYQRLCMSGDGVIRTLATADFYDGRGSMIAKNLVDFNVSNTGQAFIDTTGGYFATTTTQTVTFEEGYTVGQALETLTETGTMDVVFDPLDDTAGLFATMSVVGKRGNDNTSAIFGYDTVNYAVKSMRRLKDGTVMSNDVHVAGDRPDKGTQWTTATAQSRDSQGKYGWYQSWRPADPDITSSDFLTFLASEELNFRKNPREQLSITPFPERGPIPFNDYFVGDTIYFYCSENVRQSIQGSQRVYGMTVNVEDNGYESMGEIVVAAA